MPLIGYAITSSTPHSPCVSANTNTQPFRHFASTVSASACGGSRQAKCEGSKRHHFSLWLKKGPKRNHRNAPHEKRR